MLLPSILSGDAPHFGRLSGAAAPAAILVALGAEWLYQRLRGALEGQWGTDRGQQVAALLIMLIFAASALWTVRDYFGRYANHPDLAADFYLADWEMGQYAAEQARQGRVYLTPTQEELATILFALENQDQLRNYDGSKGLVAAGVPGSPALYLVRPDDNTSLQALQSYFTDGWLGLAAEGYIPYRVEADAARIRTEQLTDIPFGEKINLVGWTADWEGDHLLLTLAWQAKVNMEKDYTAFVHLVDGDGRLLGQLDRPPAGYPTSDWQPGEIVVDQYKVDLPDDLAQGKEIGLNTGFYYLPTLEALGETSVLQLLKWGAQD